MYKLVPVSKLKANPYRDFDETPYDKKKIDQLIKNYESTGFWGNIIARPTKTGYQIAYGHHRLEALNRKYGKGKKVEIIVKKLSNDEMLKMMAQENMEEFGTNASVECSVVRQAIEAAARGEITLPPMGKQGPGKRVCESGDSQTKYTALQIARFLGWTTDDKTKKTVVPNYACKTAFAMLDALDGGLITREQLRGLDRSVAEEVVRQAVKTRRAEEAASAQATKEAETAEASAEKERDGRKKAAKKKAAAKKRHEAKVKADNAKKVAANQAAEAVESLKSGKGSLQTVRADAASNRSSRQKKAGKPEKKAAEHLKGLSKDICKVLNPVADKKFKSFEALLSMEGSGLNQRQVDAHITEVEALLQRTKNYLKLLKSWRGKASKAKPRILSMTAG